MKRFLQLLSFLGLALIFTVAAANAQTEYTGEVEFPFAFSVRGRDYAAGSYRVTVDKNNNGTATVIINDTNNGCVQIVLARRNGDSPSSDVRLVFEKVGENRELVQVNTPGGGFAIGGNSARASVAIADIKRLYKPAVVHVSDLD